VRTTIRSIGWVGVILTTAIAVALALVLYSHPRDEGAFLTYVHRYGNYHGHPNDFSASDSALLRGGDDACEWLAHRRPALWRTGDRFRLSSLFEAYNRQMSATDRALPNAVLPGAWEYLCPGTKYLVKPHYVFSDPGD
jgi:hypothetical protein